MSDLQRGSITNVFSVDVEEYYHAAIFRRGTAGLVHGSLESRVERSVDRLLELLSAHQARGTFFVLGDVARQHPRMVRRIARDGHEVACHGNDHTDVSALTPFSFRADLRRAKARIEDAIGARVVGYRAPNFSIGPSEQAWAYRVLVEEGFLYDSSIFPIHHDRYGHPDAPRFPYAAWTDGTNRLVEFPISTVRLMGVNLPMAGGGYFRLFPLSWIRRGLRHVNRRERQPVMFYLHPWELDPDQPRPAMPWAHRFRHYVGLKRLAAKLSGLLASFRFGTARDVLQLEGERSAPALSSSSASGATAVRLTAS
jgi:polysaccharide deacetylase family protein (PEP-CTERM system associated)